MNFSQLKAVEILIDMGNDRLTQPYRGIPFTGDAAADDLLNDLEHFPHAYVLACIMDRQIATEEAWLIPWKISRELGGFAFADLQALELRWFQDIFQTKKLHWKTNEMSVNFYEAVQKIGADYHGIASEIWANTPRSGAVVRRFLAFRGVGLKIATMGANSLARDFKVPMRDHHCIDVTPDVQVSRVFHRLGFISTQYSTEQATYCARELYPEYPGVFDFFLWEIGRNWCRPRNPDCRSCYLTEYCPKNVA